MVYNRSANCYLASHTLFWTSFWPCALSHCFSGCALELAGMLQGGGRARAMHCCLGGSGPKCFLGMKEEQEVGWSNLIESASRLWSTSSTSLGLSLASSRQSLPSVENEMRDFIWGRSEEILEHSYDESTHSFFKYLLSRSQALSKALWVQS